MIDQLACVASICSISNDSSVIAVSCRRSLSNEVNDVSISCSKFLLCFIIDN